MSRILVISSMNMDNGETIQGIETSFFSGGKSALQAAQPQ
ncbi:hypothetical protein HNP81_001643 [Peribacillus huizhouensis]|uniref:Uncharacterized protein n=1 Tax=Peribacillus huizhouensis TaxID=1501239 RepID=A0ABR6CMY2_9BACI|nr:hypothetical protein [Peribacillus huizhouensis]